MSLSKNAKSRIVVVLAPLFLGFAMPWLLQVNREARNLAQYKFEPNTMLVSIVLEAALAIVFVVVFVLSLFYFAKQDNARKLLVAASVISLISFMLFALGQSIIYYPSLDNMLYYALMQMFPGLTLIIGYATAAIAVPLMKKSKRD